MWQHLDGEGPVISRTRMIIIGAILLGVTALPLAWLLNQDSHLSLQFTRAEIHALPLIDSLRSTLSKRMMAHVFAPLMSSAAIDQQVAQIQDLIAQTKKIGYESKVILDPQLDIFHLAYLCTVKLPERLKLESELLGLEDQGKRLAKEDARGDFLQKCLAEQLSEEERAVGLVLSGIGAQDTLALRSSNGDRQKAYARYQLGGRALLCAAIKADLQFWEICQQAMTDALSLRERRQLRDRQRRQMMAVIILGLALTACWLLVRRATDAAHAEELQARDKDAVKKLVRFERLAAIGQTATAVAHEVRSPLSVITMNTDLLLAKLGENIAATKLLKSIQVHSEKLSVLVGDLLENSRVSELEFQEASANDLMEVALVTARLRFGDGANGIKVIVDPCVPDKRARVDPTKLDRVLTNLILNARQAMPEGGVIVLKTRVNGDAVVFEVADSGPGIPEASLSKVFEPFFTTKNSGTGLGLWICKNIVDQHGGTIEAVNLRPHGLLHRIRLPLDGKKRAN